MATETAVREKPCCGPFVQKLRRLEELDRTIDQLRNHEKVVAAVSLADLLTQRDIVRKWLLSHNCGRNQRRRSGHASRF